VIIRQIDAYVNKKITIFMNFYLSMKIEYLLPFNQKISYIKLVF